MPSLRSILAQSALVTSTASLITFVVFTKHVDARTLNPATEPLFQSEFYRKFYPAGRARQQTQKKGGDAGVEEGWDPEAKAVLADEVVRKYPLWKLKRELVEDAEKGGSKLVEAFCGGVWGGNGYAIQRKYLERKYRNDNTTAHQLWDKKELLKNTYEEGTQVTDHFQVLSKSPTSILFRCGDSPLNLPNSPRPSDGLFEISARADLDKGFAEFRLKSVFYSGTSSPLLSSSASEDQKEVPGEKQALVYNKPLQGKAGLEEWLHVQYAKFLLETGLREIRS